MAAFPAADEWVRYVVVERKAGRRDFTDRQLFAEFVARYGKRGGYALSRDSFIRHLKTCVGRG